MSSVLRLWGCTVAGLLAGIAARASPTWVSPILPLRIAVVAIGWAVVIRGSGTWARIWWGVLARVGVVVGRRGSRGWGVVRRGRGGRGGTQRMLPYCDRR